MQTRLLIVEDQPDLTRNLAEFLEEPEFSLDFASDGLTALHLLATRDYDVVVLDVMLPGVSGYELCQRLRHDLQRDTPVIFMTARGELADKEQGFNAGADDYLVKPFPLKELLLRIRALTRRRTQENALRAGSLSFDPGTLEVTLQGQGSMAVSGIACRILEQLVREHPKFVSHETLSRVIWGTEDGDPNTLRTHVYTLRKQLQNRYGLKLISTVHGRGYRLDVES